MIHPNPLLADSSIARKLFATFNAMQGPPEKSTLESINTTSNPCLFLSAGEASGDHYGAQIVTEMRTRIPQARFFGLGGVEMQQAGLDRVVRAEDVAHMGITEVIRHMPYIYGEYRRLVAAIKKQRPDVAVLIDFPDVNFRLALELKKLGIPVIYFVSPQLWAWKRRRLRWVQERVSRMMVIFPFEERFYRARGVKAEFVGHPLAELPMPTISREDYAQQNKLKSSSAWIALLPGSRWKEVEANLPTLVETAARLGHEYEFLIPIASTLDGGRFGRFLLQLTKKIGWRSCPEIHLVTDAREAMFHARASVVASGTATVQAAVIGNPFVVVYKVSPLTFRLAKRLVHYPPEIWPSGQLDGDGNLPIGMVNLIAGRRIVPELLQTRFTAENLANEIRPLLANGSRRESMIADLAAVRRTLHPASGGTSIRRVCDAVEELLLHRAMPSGQNSTVSV
jgi:lipid-A-disaccharide synthase